MFNNKICLVTGAAQGIGKAVVERFAEQHAQMV
ncbi:beta-ketoacyl-ACP reductase, partial [Vibrio sinaloensis]